MNRSNFVGFSGLLILLLDKIGDSHGFYAGNASISNCTTPNLKPWIYFPFGVCLHLIANDRSTSICHKQLIDSLTENGVTIYQKSSISMKNRNILNRTKTNCESYLLVMENHQQWFDDIINQPLNKTQRIFFPFSRLYFLSFNVNDDTNLINDNLIKYLYRNALFGYHFHLDGNDRQVISVHDIVNNLTTKSRPNHTDIGHPLLDTNVQRGEFNVSAFRCPPHIFHADETGRRIDGIEYRFLTHVLKKWKVRFLFQNESIIPFNPFGSMFGQLAKGRSDVVACGIWQSNMHSNKDLTSYFDYNCNTWIAPKPRKLDPASLVYLTLSTPVWGVYVSCFVCTAMLLTIISKIEEDIRNTKIASSKFGRSFLEATNAATSHGITNLPNQISVQFLLISWHILNLLVGAGYTTIYTSRLTKPGYTKPVDTFEDFVEQGISWISRHEYDSLKDSLKESTRPAFRIMYNTLQLEHSEEQLVKSLRTGHYGVFMSIRSNKFPVDIERITHPSAAGIWNLFRFMKVCFYSHFSVFALRKHSPYTVLFNGHIRRYQECGLIKHWFEELYRKNELMDTLFETHPRHNDEPKLLTLWDMRGAFFVLLTGLSIAIVAYLCEFSFMELKKVLSWNRTAFV